MPARRQTLSAALRRSRLRLSSLPVPPRRLARRISAPARCVWLIPPRLTEQPLAADSAKRARMPFKAPTLGGSTTTPSRPSKATPSKPFASVTRGFKPIIPTGSSTPVSRTKPRQSSGHPITPFRAPTLAGAMPTPTTADSPHAGPSKMALTSEVQRLERRLRVLQQALRYRDMPAEQAERPAMLERQGARWLQHGRAAAELLWTVSGGADGKPTEQALPRQSLFEDDDRGRWGRGNVSYTTLSSAEKDALSDAEAADPLPSTEELQNEVRRRVERNVRQHRSNPPSSEVDVPKPAVRGSHPVRH